MDENCKNKCDERISYGYIGRVNDVSFRLADVGEVSIHSALQDDYLNDDWNNIAMYTKKSDQELSKPVAIRLDFKVAGAKKSIRHVIVSENIDFIDAKEYITSSDYLDLINLKIGQDYYWKVIANNVSSGIAKFKTKSNGPRNLDIDKLVNFRDLGGWETINGFTIRQGLIYRCGALNYNESKQAIISALGIKQLKELGIKSEIDLRGSKENENGNINESLIGKDVKYYNVKMKFGSLLENNASAVAEVFHILANKDNYPCIIHCAGGTDRTGMIAFFIGALCGMSYHNLMKDYFFSNFYNSNDPRLLSNFYDTKYYEIISKEKGDNLLIKTYNTLCKYGVSSEDIDAVMEIMIDRY